jgi:CubicO group peptidase (beta-lactamase class C family)
MNALARFAVGCLALALGGCSDSDDGSGGSNEPKLSPELRRRIDDAVEAGFSGAILVIANGERLTTEAHGLADRETNTPNTPDTAFDVGSILKTFTATAIFRLVEDGALTLDTTLDQVFPDVPADKAGISVLEVVQHRAGFDEYHDTTGDFEVMTRLEARERIFAQELLFAPGTDEAYSNSGYTLLADVIETLTDEPYVDFVRHALFEPAKMTTSGFYSEPVWRTVDTAIGYDASTFGDNDPATWPYTWALVGNGGLVMTVGDLDRFIAALFDGVIVAPETVALMEEALAGDAAMESGELVYAVAGGGDYGLGGIAIFAPESETRVIVATNTAEVFDIESLAAELAQSLLAGE